MDREQVLAKIQDIKNTVTASILPNIYLIHGELSDTEMNELYNHDKVKAMVNLTKGEGFGRPLLEFSFTDKPIITTNYSGHIDFLSPEHTTLLNGDLTNVHSSAAVKDMIMEEFKWFSVHHQDATAALRDMYTNHSRYKTRSTKQGELNREKFTLTKMGQQLDTYIEKYGGHKLVKQIEFNLPTEGIVPPHRKKLEHA